MTEGPQQPAIPAETPPAAVLSPAIPVVAPPPTTTKIGPIRRGLNWFWRGRELKQLRREQSLDSPRVRELELRARVLFELGQRARRPSEPLPALAEAAAAELFRQSAYWAVRGVAVMRAVTATNPWQALGDEVRAKLAGGGERASELVRLVEDGNFVEAWDLSEHERALRTSELAGTAQILLDELAWRTRARDALWIQRVMRIGLLVAVIFGAVAGTRWLVDRSEQRRDLAIGKPWRASSTAPGLGCTSPLQECGDSSDFFFHTNSQRDPWLEIDLGKPMRFSAVRVENRRDCCFDRAAPLVIELGNDTTRFREVARRTTSFSSWLATFSTTEARYVRLRVPKESLFHLSRVRVLQ